MTNYDVVFSGGTVLDGTGGSCFVGDVALEADRIAALGPAGTLKGQRRIDVAGLVVAPGFIDVHTHDDRVVLSPRASLPKLSQGVTTVVTGNCGISLAPGRPEKIPAPLDLIADSNSMRYANFADYLNEVTDVQPGVNVAALVGHTTLRLSAMSRLDRPATHAEALEMQGCLREALQAGAFGLSTGTFYPPARAADVDEIVTVGEPLRHFGAFYATHMRDEADHIIESIDETLLIGRRLGVRVVFSHHKLAGISNHGRSPQTLARLAAAMERQPVSIDCYPYNASSTMLQPDLVARAATVIVTYSEPHPQYAGKDLASIAAQMDCSAEEAAAALMPAGAIYFMMDEQDVRRILSFPRTMIGSDGMPHDRHPHPRLWGTFPRVLGHYAREAGLFSLEKAVFKMTGLPATDLGLVDRGFVKAGCFADLAIFDPATVKDTATFDNPSRPAAGISSVWVNGRIAFSDGKQSDTSHGRVLKPRAAPI